MTGEAKKYGLILNEENNIIDANESEFLGYEISLNDES